MVAEKDHRPPKQKKKTNKNKTTNTTKQINFETHYTSTTYAADSNEEYVTCARYAKQRRHHDQQRAARQCHFPMLVCQTQTRQKRCRLDIKSKFLFFLKFERKIATIIRNQTVVDERRTTKRRLATNIFFCFVGDASSERSSKQLLSTQTIIEFEILSILNEI
jgi:hypothetical protein